MRACVSALLCLVMGGLGQRSLACVRECSALLGLALALAIGVGDSSLFSYRRVGSGGRLLLGQFLFYDRSTANSSVEGRRRGRAVAPLQQSQRERVAPQPLAGYFTAGGGCSSPTAAGSSPAA
ncbi:hypothetical protein B296_00052015 [Ensete ventricosum]|uniref:Secreted protein n=1 Tax=Ensete ventricosum TaxID=4639 RepID=A0A426Y666_ENSVE|nr:hypothetical protein B296_00052015 [Ensete ventricosum]